jgi:hypothetical protein
LSEKSVESSVDPLRPLALRSYLLALDIATRKQISSLFLLAALLKQWAAGAEFL